MGEVEGQFNMFQCENVSRFIEKPAPGESDSRNASVVFYLFRPDSLAFVNK